jgi:hypothetical protein
MRAQREREGETQGSSSACIFPFCDRCCRCPPPRPPRSTTFFLLGRLLMALSLASHSPATVTTGAAKTPPPILLSPASILLTKKEQTRLLLLLHHLLLLFAAVVQESLGGLPVPAMENLVDRGQVIDACPCSSQCLLFLDRVLLGDLIFYTLTSLLIRRYIARFLLVGNRRACAAGSFMSYLLVTKQPRAPCMRFLLRILYGEEAVI